MKHIHLQAVQRSRTWAAQQDKDRGVTRDEPPGSVEVQSFSAPANPVLTLWETTCSQISKSKLFFPCTPSIPHQNFPLGDVGLELPVVSHGVQLQQPRWRFLLPRHSIASYSHHSRPGHGTGRVPAGGRGGWPQSPLWPGVSGPALDSRLLVGFCLTPSAIRARLFCSSIITYKLVNRKKIFKLIWNKSDILFFTSGEIFNYNNVALSF